MQPEKSPRVNVDKTVNGYSKIWWIYVNIPVITDM